MTDTIVITGTIICASLIVSHPIYHEVKSQLKWRRQRKLLREKRRIEAIVGEYLRNR